MGIESGPGGFTDVERIELPISDESLRNTVLDTERSRELYDRDPVLWLRGAVGVDSERDASEVSDAEITTLLVNGGFAEWDPHIVKAVKAYLDSKGIFYTI